MCVYYRDFMFCNKAELFPFMGLIEAQDNVGTKLPDGYNRLQ
jgi:hypothetical protein